MTTESYDCPRCFVGIPRDQVVRRGILHGRPSARGGPFYTLECPECREPLLAEFQDGLRAGLVLRRERWTLFGRAQRPKRSVRSSLLHEPRAPESKSERDSDHREARVPLDLIRALDVLGLSAGAALTDVKKAFRDLAKSKHPDLWADAADDERAEAEREFARIVEAYHTILEAHRKLGLR